MNGISREDWNLAQGVLVQLAKLLPELTGERRESSPLPAIPTAYARLFSFAIDKNPVPIKNKISLILKQAQAQISAIIEEPTAPKSKEKTVESVKSPQEPNSEKRSPILSKNAPASIAQPAKLAIDEVRIAIRSLATSSNLVLPQQEQVKRALEKVKPHLDRLIDAVEANPDMHSAADERREPALPPSRMNRERETLFKNKPPLPFVESQSIKRLEKEISQRDSVLSKKSERQPTAQIQEAQKPARKNNGPIIEHSPESRDSPARVEKQIAPSIVPYTAAGPINPKKPKKKKRLFPWDDRDDEDDPKRHS